MTGAQALSDGENLSRFARAVRESTLKRLARVPAGRENWRPSSGSLSVADLAHHLLHADFWLFEKLANPLLPGMVARAGEAGVVDAAEFQEIVRQLDQSGEARAVLVARLSPDELQARIPDDRFGGDDVTVWWMIVRGNLDHEAHHRGQLAAYLRILADQEAHD